MNTKKICICSLMIAISLMFSYIESLFPIYLGVPGAKLGLANLVIVLAIYLFGPREAFLINLVRIMITGLLFTNLYSVLFSLAGAFTSFTIMVILYKSKYFSMIGISILGGVFHHLGQIIVAAFVLETVQIFFYLPILCIVGAITGGLLGLLDQILFPRIQKLSFQEGK